MGTAEVERYLLDRERGASRRQALEELRRRGMHEGYGKQLDRRLRVAVNRAKALWPQAADQDLGGLEWIWAVCAPLCESRPLLSLNRFCLANQVNAVCFCRSSILLFRMAPNSARNRPSARTAGGSVGSGSSPPKEPSMTREEREHRERQITEFRYQLVAELANPYLSGAERRELIRQKAAVEHEVPLLGRRRYTASCIHKWLLLYRKHGRVGLAPRARRDAGRSRTMSETEAAVLLLYLENHPELTAAAALRTLQADGRISSYPSTSALSRLVRSAGLQRRERQRQLHGAEQKLKFGFFAPLECVQVDCMHALKLPDPNGRRRMAILLAFLDDATRRILYACWAWRESAIAFEAGIRHILAAHGRIGRLYCDNRSPFVSTQTRRSA